MLLHSHRFHPPLIRNPARQLPHRRGGQLPARNEDGAHGSMLHRELIIYFDQPEFISRESRPEGLVVVFKNLSHQFGLLFNRRQMILSREAVYRDVAGSHVLFEVPSGDDRVGQNGLLAHPGEGLGDPFRDHGLLRSRTDHGDPERHGNFHVAVARSTRNLLTGNHFAE